MSIKPNRHPPPGSAGNTQGLIVPQTAPHASGAGNPAPEPRAEAETQGWWKRWGSDVAHGALDVVGLIPVLGEAADGLNAVIYVAEGDYVSAALSAAAMLPVGGQAATAAKFGKKAAEAGIDASRQAAKQAGKQAGKEAAEEGTEQAAKKAAGKQDGGYVEKPKPKQKPRQPQKYEKKVVNDDGSVTYTLKTKNGELFEVTYKDGYPDFSQYKYNGPRKPEVKIEMTGNNNIDFNQANKEAGFGRTPDGYTWHHHQDGATMQLIRTDVHGATPHTGGASASRAK